MALSLVASQWLHHPVTSWHTRSFQTAHGLDAEGRALDRQVAWQVVWMCRRGAPPYDVHGTGRWHGVDDELYARSGITIETAEEIETLSARETAWRLAWLEKYGVTPLHTLGATNKLMKAAGVSIRDWFGSRILD